MLSSEEAATAAAATEASMTVEAFEISKNTASSSSASSFPKSPFEAAAASTSALARRRNARLDRRDRESEHFDARRALDRLANAVARGAATGALLRGGLHAVSLALAAAAPARRRRRALAGAPGPAAASADAARYAAFLGAFAGAYVLLDEGIARGLGKKKTAAWRAAASGACAAPAVLLLGRKQRHTSLAIYLLLRGATLLVRVGNKPLPPSASSSSSSSSEAPSSSSSLPAAARAPTKPGAARAPTKAGGDREAEALRAKAADASLQRQRLVRRLLTPTRWEHGDTLLMCLAASQITYSWIIKPHTLPAAFVRFLNRHGGHDLWFYDAARELASRPAGVTGPVKALVGTPHEGLVGAHPCDWAHPGTTCDGNAAAFFPAALARALPVYLPVYLVPALLVHGRKLLPGANNPGASLLWKKLATGCLRSSTFLALYCTLCWRGACVGFQLTGRLGPSTIPGFAWMGGLATLVEKKSRRMELALYCVSRAAESFALCLPEWGLVPKRRSSLAVSSSPGKLKPRLGPRYDLVMLCAASAAICHCYSDSKGAHRDVFRSKYLSVLDFILGSDGVERGSIRHSPSASDLVARAVAASPSLPALPTVSSLQAALPSLTASISMPQLPSLPQPAAAMLQPAAAAASLAASQAAAAAAGCAGAIASGAAAGAGALAVAAAPVAAALATRARSFLDLLSSEEYEGGAADSPRGERESDDSDGQGRFEVEVREGFVSTTMTKATVSSGETEGTSLQNFHRHCRYSSTHTPTIEEGPGVVAAAAAEEEDGGGGTEFYREDGDDEGEKEGGEDVDDEGAAAELAATPRRSTKPLRFRKSRHNWEALLSCDIDDGGSAAPSLAGADGPSAAPAVPAAEHGASAAAVRSRNPVIPDSLLAAMSSPPPVFVRGSQGSVSASVARNETEAAAVEAVAATVAASAAVAAKHGFPSSRVSPRLDVRAAGVSKRMSSFGGDEALAP